MDEIKKRIVKAVEKINNNNGEHLYMYSAFPHIRAQSALTLSITPIDHRYQSETISTSWEVYSPAAC